MVVSLRFDTGSVTGGSNLCKLMDPRQLVSVVLANIDCETQPVVAGDLGLMRSNSFTLVRLKVTVINYGSPSTVSCGLDHVCPTVATHEMMVKCSVNSGTPPLVSNDLLELVCTMAATHTIMALCACNSFFYSS
jgi:hypothetical protein